MYWCSFLKNQQWSKDYDEGLSDAGNDKGYERKVRPLYILMKTVRIGHWSVTIWNQPLRARALLRPKCWKTKCLRRKQGFTYRPNFLANWDWKTRIFGNLAYVASVSARVRGECWDESKKEKWTELSFLLLSLQLSCDYSNGNWIISTYTEALYLHRGYAMAMLMTCFQFFFYYRNGYVIASHAGVFPPGNDGACTHPPPTPRPSETKLLYFFILSLSKTF